MVVTSCFDIGVSEQEDRKDDGDHIPTGKNEAFAIVNTSRYVS